MTKIESAYSTGMQPARKDASKRTAVRFAYQCRFTGIVFSAVEHTTDSLAQHSSKAQVELIESLHPFLLGTSAKILLSSDKVNSAEMNASLQQANLMLAGYLYSLVERGLLTFSSPLQFLNPAHAAYKAVPQSFATRLLKLAASAAYSLQWPADAVLSAGAITAKRVRKNGSAYAKSMATQARVSEQSAKELWARFPKYNYGETSTLESLFTWLHNCMEIHTLGYSTDKDIADAVQEQEALEAAKLAVKERISVTAKLAELKRTKEGMENLLQWGCAYMERTVKEVETTVHWTAKTSELLRKLVQARSIASLSVAKYIRVSLAELLPCTGTEGKSAEVLLYTVDSRIVEIAQQQADVAAAFGLKDSLSEATAILSEYSNDEYSVAAIQAASDAVPASIKSGAKAFTLDSAEITEGKPLARAPAQRNLAVNNNVRSAAYAASAGLNAIDSAPIIGTSAAERIREKMRAARIASKGQ